MAYVIDGDEQAGSTRYAIVVAKFNSDITERLLSSCIDTLSMAGVNPNKTPVVKVPGSLELPVVARRLAETGKYDAIICLGCVIRGATTHYDVVVNGAQQGCTIASQETGVPIMCGVITAEDRDQAEERSNASLKTNLGADAARAAVHMATVMQKLPGSASTLRRANGGAA